jgi:hypothetical protein
MGVIFRRDDVPRDALEAFMAEGVRPHIESALAQTPLAAGGTAAQTQQFLEPAAKAAAQVARERKGAVHIAPGPFLVAVGLFFILLGVAIVVDWKDLVSDPKVYSGMATTFLGVVVGFFGGDAAGTATSN